MLALKSAPKGCIRLPSNQSLRGETAQSYNPLVLAQSLRHNCPELTCRTLRKAFNKLAHP